MFIPLCFLKKRKYPFKVSCFLNYSETNVMFSKSNFSSFLLKVSGSCHIGKDAPSAKVRET